MKDQKGPIIEKIHKLTECAGSVTPWGRVAFELRKMGVQELEALRYRIERSIADAFDQGSRLGGSYVDVPAERS